MVYYNFFYTIKSSDSRISTDDKMSTLIVKECLIEDEGDYEVVIETATGEVSHMFEIMVNAEAPTIVQALPQNVDVDLHKPAVLKVKFDSPTQSQVEWLANGVSLDKTNKYGITSTTEETTLEIADVLKDDTEMVYTCRVKNAVGQAETATSLTLPSKFSYMASL